MSRQAEARLVPPASPQVHEADQGLRIAAVARNVYALVGVHRQVVQLHGGDFSLEPPERIQRHGNAHRLDCNVDAKVLADYPYAKPKIWCSHAVPHARDIDWLRFSLLLGTVA